MRTQASTQRGVATIAGVLVLLALVALALLHSEQHAAAERHASESHVRRTRDAQVASAGLDWALAQLNEPRFAQARCAASDPARIRFRQRALQEAKLHAQCGVDAYGALECRCSPEGMGEPRFYEPVDRGLEIKIGEKLAQLRELNARQRTKR